MTDLNKMKSPELKKLATELAIPGRSKMKADELRSAIRAHQASTSTLTPSSEPSIEEVAQNHLLNTPRVTIGGAVKGTLESINPDNDGADNSWRTAPNRREKRAWKYGGRKRHERELARQRRTEEYEARRERSRLAGSCGRSAKPMSFERRGMIYAMSGSPKGMTPRQRRRAWHKSRHYLNGA